MDKVEPQQYPTVMVLGDAADPSHTAEQADTRAIIALLLLRDFRTLGGLKKQKVCSEILEPKNRELAATTEIHDIVISNEMVSMVLAQITHEPRVGPVLEDLFRSEGSEIYLKALRIYADLNEPVTFEELILRAKKRNEVALGLSGLRRRRQEALRHRAESERPPRDHRAQGRRPIDRAGRRRWLRVTLACQKSPAAI